MEKIAGNLSKQLEDTLGLYQELRQLLEVEKEYIVKMDVEKIWQATEQKKNLAKSIETLIADILSFSKQYISRLDMGVSSFHISALVKELPLALKDKTRLKSIGLKIDACKKEITLLGRENKRYINEYLSVIDGIFSTVKQQDRTRDQYSRAGRVYAGGQQAHLISAEV